MRKPAAKQGSGQWKGQRAYRSGKRSARGGLAGVSQRLGMKRSDWAVVFLRVAIACVIIGGIGVMYFMHTLPDIRSINTIKKQQGITVLTEDGRVIANYGDVYGRYIPYEQLPRPLVQAVVATEDRRFFEHHGVDFWGIARAMAINIAHGHVVQGGSTVTQQVAKNVFLTPERSFTRKIQEVLLAFMLEARFSKKEIMAIYLNRVYLGGGTFGVDAAAHRYFNKSATDLNLFESALMAGLLKAPSRYSPASNLDRSRDRVHQVLLNMVDAGYLKKSQIQPALDNYVKSPAKETTGGDARYFGDWVVDEIPQYIGDGVNEDLVVTTTMSTTLQQAATDSLQNTIGMQGQNKNVSQGALVAMTPDGAVKAMVGGLNYSASQFNRAAVAKRQPGSSFKLFVYLAALEAGYNPQTIVTDAPITLTVGNKSWSPDNDEKNEYRGDIPLHEALRYSLNTVSVRLITAIGPARVAKMAERLGIPGVPAYPSIALGAVEATLLEMTGAYAHLPNHGNHVEPYGILTIKTVKGDSLYTREEQPEEQVLSDSDVKQMNYMLLDVVQHGTGTKAGLAKRPVAGKTGTSQDFKDAWFIGFTPQLVTGVWMGNDDNKSMKKIYGGTLPAAAWHDFMAFAMQGVPVAQIPSEAGSSSFMPWLFGEGENASGNPANAPAAQPLPEDVPFGHATPAPGQPPETEAALSYTVVPKPEGNTPPTAAATPPRNANGDVLTPQFWNQLMKDAPKKLREQKVEYNYPGGNSR